MTQYAIRNAIELDRNGGHYSRHVAALTEESLHSKSAIAAELAWRDMRIAELENCGQDGVCVLSPGCMRHWGERNRELVNERDAAKTKFATALRAAEQRELDALAELDEARAEKAVTDERLAKALDLVDRFGGIPENHHRAWVIDQVVRILATDYAAWVAARRTDGYGWYEGIAP